MNRAIPIAGIAASLIVGALIAFAVSPGSKTIIEVPLFAACVALAFLIQWIAFIPAYALQTERFFDLTGSLTYLLLVVTSLTLGNLDPRSLLLGALVTIWAVRLGSFLFARIHQAGEDRRFRSIKPDFAMFLMTWTLQGLWVSLTLACALAVMTSAATTPLDAYAWVGALLWVAGFGLEVVADAQKSAFRADPANSNRFISSGLWAWSRHPNYFGEILLWTGVAVIAWPALAGWQLLTLISPLFVLLLLTQISGVRMLEERAEKQWGQDPEYQVYKSGTPSLLLRRPRG